MNGQQVFLDRAQQLGDGRDLLNSDEGFAAATALLAVHTAIALNDALLLELTGKQAKAISFDERLLEKNTESEPSLLSLLVRPERFLLRGEKLDELELFLVRAKPDMQVRV